MEDILEELLQHRDPEALQQCLSKVRALWERGLHQRGLLTAPSADWRGRRGWDAFIEGLSVPIYEMGAVLGVLSGPTALQP